MKSHVRMKSEIIFLEKWIAKTMFLYLTPTLLETISGVCVVLVDHEGKPFKRYNHARSPFTMKDDIEELLRRKEEAVKKRLSLESSWNQFQIARLQKDFVLSFKYDGRQKWSLDEKKH